MQVLEFQFQKGVKPRSFKGRDNADRAHSIGNSNTPDMADRLLTALFAPLLFNLGLLLLSGVLLHWWSPRPRIVAQETFRLVSMVVELDAQGLAVFIRLQVILCWVLPMIAGAMLGSEKFAALLAHLFYTHEVDAKNPLVTTVLWSLLLIVAALGINGFGSWS